FRALLYQLEKDGLHGKTWAGHTSEEPGFWERIQGFAQYIRMVQPEKGEKLCAQLQVIRQKYPDTGYFFVSQTQVKPSLSSSELQAKARKTAFRQNSAFAELPLPGQRVAPVPPPPCIAETILDRSILAEVEAAWQAHETQTTQSVTVSDTQGGQA
ncbi:MAG: hypothetical protein AB7I41_21835, partial [Candidatus Sericytochromatia bacterium]